ncbi:MAG: fuconate dehydratase [Saccharothrix sp.]|nr:fuconate dehydratase [Saccharothrix sp.]
MTTVTPADAVPERAAPSRTTITAVEVVDVRFPTSATAEGSDAMNPDGDYSAAYVIVRTTDRELTGYGLTFTIGRGNDVCVSLAGQLSRALIGLDVADLATGPGLGRLYRELVNDSQLRWLGPEKGAVHLAVAAVVNAAWDLAARHHGVPLWRLLVEMPVDDLIAACDFRYLDNELTPDEARRMLEAMRPGRDERIAVLEAGGYPAYTTSPGWLGYDDDKLRRLVRQAVEDGWTHVKLKVGGSVEDDVRRLRVAREELGPDRTLMIDSNQVWEAREAVEWVSALAEFRPLWIEEPTSPDDLVGHAQVRAGLAPLGIGVATGEHVHNRVMFKQLLQLEAIDFCQVDSCRLAGVNEIVPVLLMAAKRGIPVCPHAGGVGLCEYVQHLSIFDFVAVSGTLDGRVAEYVDNLHEHFLTPVVVEGGAYRVPTDPGYSIEMRPESVRRFTFPDGEYWRDAR